MRIASVTGTGTDNVRAIFRALGHDLVFVSSVQDAYHIRFDRLLLLGGVDVDPGFYGERNTLSQRSDSNRDKMEWALTRRAIVDNVPIMGICRGSQMLAVASGGSLYQDIVRQCRVWHRYGSHGLTNIKNPLARWIPGHQVNSYHHQAVRDVPTGFSVVATSEDGIIESIWRPGALGVQWHPELLFEEDYRWIHLFRWLIEGLV
jgi:putative glutamine amidotransferase